MERDGGGRSGGEGHDRGGARAHQIQPRPASGEGIVLKGRGPEVCIHNMARLLVQMAHPASKLAGIGQGGRKEHHAYALGQEDDGLLPHNAPLPVLHVMHLIKDHPGNLSKDLRTPAQHEA